MSIGVCRLDEVADVQLGLQTFLNKFFFLDDATIKKFSIEAVHRQPVFRTKDMNRASFQQKVSSCELQLFLCNQKLTALVGTGAAAYIKWGAGQQHKAKGDKPGGLWKDTPRLNTDKKPWYQNRSLPPATRIVLLKAFDDTFSPLILDKPVGVDQRFNQVTPKTGVSEDLLIGLLCSGWFVMLCETYGGTAMGQGALEMRTDVLKGLPVPDIRNLDPTTAKRWTAATKALLKGNRLPAQQMSKSKPQRALDAVVLEALALDPARLDELYEDTVRMGAVRRRLAAGRGTIKRERFAADLGQVAADTAAQLGLLLANRRFPDSFLPAGAKTDDVHLGDGPLSIHAEHLLGQRHAVIKTKGTTVYDNQLSEQQAELLLRAIQLGQRDIAVPQDPADADKAVTELAQLCTQLEVKFQELSVDVGAAHRGPLRTEVEQSLNFPFTRASQAIEDVYTDEFRRAP
jgi:hypothetical protein